MRRIKIKLPFSNESLLKRRFDLIETAKILSNNEKFTIVEEEHYDKMSYIVIFVLEDSDKIKID
ncbi:MAG: hypothetical protein JXL97_07395 [Bacteroidales bacterium]|nr:hypothetical protein [Bacteroidales bacterium]